MGNIVRGLKVILSLSAIALTGSLSASEWTLSHVGAAHCGRYVEEEVDGIARRGSAWCEWPGQNGRIHLKAQCENDGQGGIAFGGDHELMESLSETGQIESGSKWPFDTERVMMADYIADCQGMATQVQALPIVGNDPAIGWVEHASMRPGGCQWLTLAPLRSEFRGPRSERPILFNAETGRTARREGGVPILLADCCTGEAGGPPARPLFTFMDMGSFEGDPQAAQVVNPLDWIAALWFSARGPFYDKVAKFELTAGDEAFTERTRLKLESVVWSTRTSYKATIDSDLFADAFRDGGEVSLRINWPNRYEDDVSGIATFLTGERTRRFLEACSKPRSNASRA